MWRLSEQTQARFLSRRPIRSVIKSRKLAGPTNGPELDHAGNAKRERRPSARVLASLRRLGTPIRSLGWTSPLCPSNPRAMEQQAFSVRAVLAGEAPQNAPVTVKGWVRTRRDSKAGISFVHLSDGSSFHPLQVVVAKTLSNYTDEVLNLTTGCAVEARGTIVPSPAKGQPFEMQASAVRVVGWVDNHDTYQIQPERHSLEFLREVVNLQPRQNLISAATRVRHTLAQAVHRFFDENGFFWVNTPIITASDAEGAGALFRVSTLDLA